MKIVLGFFRGGIFLINKTLKTDMGFFGVAVKTISETMVFNPVKEPVAREFQVNSLAFPS